MRAQSDNGAADDMGSVPQKVRQALFLLVNDKANLGCILGFALMYSWNLMGAADPGASAYPSGIGEPIAVGATSLSNALGYLIAAFVLSRIGGFPRISLMLSGVVFLVSMAAVVAVGAGMVDERFFLACRAVSRVCAASVTVCWLGRFSRLEPKWVTPCCIAGFLGASAIGLAALAVEGVGKQLLYALLLPISMAVFFRTPDPGRILPARGRDSVRAAVKFAASVWRPLAIFFVFGIVSWTVSIGVNAPVSDWVSPATFACTMVATAVLLVASLVAGAPFSIDYVYKIVVPIVFAGLVVIVTASRMSALGAVLVQTGYSCFDVFCLAVVVGASGRTGVRPEAALGVCRAVECSAPLFAVATVWISGVGSDAEGLMRVLAAAGSLALFLAAFMGKGVFEATASSPAEDLPRPQAMLFALQCEQAVSRFRLTPREGEVMGLIARGRSVPHITERLGISRSTAKTYVARIYEKMGVGDRQEMLDVIESLSVEG